MNNNELCVPAQAVSLSGQSDDGGPGENDNAAVAPEVGDSVEVTIKGKVTRSEGGNVYVLPTEANGMPLDGSADEPGAPAEDTEASMDQAMGAGGGSGALMAFLLAIAAVLGFSGVALAADELRMANRLDCSTIGTNNWVAFSNQASVVFSVEIDNFSGSDIYLHVFEKGTNAVAGDQPIASVVKVSNGTTGGKNWNSTGIKLQSLCVAASTTPYKLTNAAAGTGIVTVQRRREPF